MGISSKLPSAWLKVLISKIFIDVEADVSLEKLLSCKEKKVLNSISFKKKDSEELLSPKSSANQILGHSLSFKIWEPDKNKLQISVSFEGQNLDFEQPNSVSFSPEGRSAPLLGPANCSPDLISSGATNEENAAALKIQKVYRGHRIRRSLADCAVVIEELWWKALDFASLKRSSVSFFDVKKPETAVSRWARARTRAAKVGKGLSKDNKAQKLALQHWLEAIDPRHRYGHSLHLYYDVWFASESTQPFFYWLDIGDGKEVNLEKCYRSRLQSQCIRYLGPKEREAYEVIIVSGKLLYKKTPLLLDTVEGSKWIFVLSTTRNLYVGKKEKGKFQHSSFLSGGAITAAGRLIAKNGVLQAIWPYSGHYLPTEENFKEFISFLEEHNVDLSNVKRYAVDDDEYPSFRRVNKKSQVDIEMTDTTVTQKASKMADFGRIKKDDSSTVSSLEDMDSNISDRLEPHPFDFSNRLSCKWSSGVGPRISCVRDYPTDLQFKALEQVNLSPRPIASPTANKTPIPSPRPSPGVMLSPRLAYIGLPSPRISLTLPPLKKS